MTSEWRFRALDYIDVRVKGGTPFRCAK
jgi:hypothetical protein